MIIQFSVANYRSIHSPQTLNFRATSLVSEDKEVDANNISNIGKGGVLKAIGIYGANASGKSNIIKGLVFFKEMVSSSINDEELSIRGMNPYKLNAREPEHYGFFEIVLILEDKKYRYGFTLSKQGDIASEWLKGTAEKNETFYFIRKDGKIEVNAIWFQEADDLPKEKLRSNALFLSFCSTYNGRISSLIKEYISEKIYVDQTNLWNPRRFMRRFSNNLTDKLVESGQKDIVLQWMKEAGMHYSGVLLKKVEYSRDLVDQIVYFQKDILDNEGKKQGSIDMLLRGDESDGTQKYYGYIGILIRLFESGGLFISDEIDNNFHPSLLRKILSFFNNPVINKSAAQLVFTSHDTNLMKPELMRRDQFYFTEKSMRDETILYSLSDLKGIRNNADFASQYLAGLYGALPVLSSFLEEGQSDHQSTSKES